MIEKLSQKKLLSIIRDEMIPEYKSLEEQREKLKEVFLKWVNLRFMTDRDKELIKKYPKLISMVSNIPVCRYYESGIDLSRSKYYERDFFSEDNMSLYFKDPIPKVIDSVYEIKSMFEEDWKMISPEFHHFINIRNTLVEKLNIAYEFISHKNTTITLIKSEFPELYKLYKK